MPHRVYATLAAVLVAALALAAACSGGGSSSAAAPALDASKIAPACFQGGAFTADQARRRVRRRRLERSPRAEGRRAVLDVRVVQHGFRADAAFAGTDLPLHLERRLDLDPESVDAGADGERRAMGPGRQR